MGRAQNKLWTLTKTEYYKKEIIQRQRTNRIVPANDVSATSYHIIYNSVAVQTHSQQRITCYGKLLENTAATKVNVAQLFP